LLKSASLQVVLYAAVDLGQRLLHRRQISSVHASSLHGASRGFARDQLTLNFLPKALLIGQGFLDDQKFAREGLVHIQLRVELLRKLFGLLLNFSLRGGRSEIVTLLVFLKLLLEFGDLSTLLLSLLLDGSTQLRLSSELGLELADLLSLVLHSLLDLLGNLSRDWLGRLRSGNRLCWGSLSLLLLGGLGFLLLNLLNWRLLFLSWLGS
jgi:hypothetical protein